MWSTVIQTEIAAAVGSKASVQPHTGIGVVGIEPVGHEHWRVWVHRHSPPRLLLFLVGLRGNADRLTFDIQRGLDIVAARSLQERRPALLQGQVHRLVGDYGWRIGKLAFWSSEIDTPHHPLFDPADRLWFIQVASQDRGEHSGLLPLVVWLHDEVLYLACGLHLSWETTVSPWPVGP